MSAILTRAAAYVIVFLVGLLMGAYVGYDWRDDRIQSSENAALREAAAKAQEDAVRSSEVEVALVRDNERVSNNVDAIKQLAVKRVKATEQTRGPFPQILETIVVRPVDPVVLIDVGTVWLLDAARRNDTVLPSALGDEAAAEPSDVTLSELIANDLEIVKLYHQLANEHRTLIQAVKDEMRKRGQTVPNYD